jgi:GntR family transcriptional regulator
MKTGHAQIRIDLAAAEPAWRQISVQLRTLIVEGVLKPGDILPPVRRLATDLAVHFNTVAEAYRQLAAEGWLDVGHGRNARVIERTAPKPDASTLEKQRLRLRGLLAEMKASGVPVHRIKQELKTLMEAMES